MATPAVTPPATLPADFAGFDAAPTANTAPSTLPANFQGFDGPAPLVPGGTISPVDHASIFQDFENDVKQGGGRTAVGRLIGRLQGRGDAGMTGLESGVSKGAANFVGSPLEGTAETLNAASTIPQHPIKGTLGVVGGLLHAATIPGMMVGGPATDAAITAIPSKAHAGQILSDIASHAQIEPVFPNAMSTPLMRLYELGQRGSTLPKAVGQLIQRTTTPGAADILYPEARDFASKVSQLSANEMQSLTPTMRSALGALRSGLHEDIAQAAANVGHPGEYAQAVKEYAQASQLGQAASKAGKYLAGTAVGAAGLGGAHKLWSILSGQ